MVDLILFRREGRKVQSSFPVLTRKGRHMDCGVLLKKFVDGGGANIIIVASNLPSIIPLDYCSHQS